MSHTYGRVAKADRSQAILAQIASIALALALALSATIALTKTEILVARASNISNSDLNMILSSSHGLY
jgi:hypothetical protein